MSADQPITPAELAEWQTVCEAIRDGDWRAARTARGMTVENQDEEMVFIETYGITHTSPENAAFIATARTAMPRLITEVERLEYAHTEAQTDLDNEREFREEWEKRYALMRTEVQRLSEVVARRNAERDALAARIAKVEALVVRVENRMMATAKPEEIREALREGE